MRGVFEKKKKNYVWRFWENPLWLQVPTPTQIMYDRYALGKNP